MFYIGSSHPRNLYLIYFIHINFSRNLQKRTPKYLQLLLSNKTQSAFIAN